MDGMWGVRAVLFLFICGRLAAAEFTVATYNVRNYLVQPAAGRKAKPLAARDAIVDGLVRLDADVVSLQEVGGDAALADLHRRLLARGINYPYRALLQARDPAIQLAVLSRYPITTSRGHTNAQYLVEGTRQRLRRGILETEIAVGADYRFTLLTVHLKSKRSVPYARESELRKNEAIVLRRRVETILTADPAANLMVLGDLNDTPESTVVRLVQGRGTRVLTDVAPTARRFAGHNVGAPGNWTHFYRRTGEHTRLDYVLISPGMRPEHLPRASFTAELPAWSEASDHRPVVAGFVIGDR